MNYELIREQLFDMVIVAFSCGFCLAVIVAIFYSVFISKEGRG